MLFFSAVQNDWAECECTLTLTLVNNLLWRVKLTVDRLTSLISYTCRKTDSKKGWKAALLVEPQQKKQANKARACLTKSDLKQKNLQTNFFECSYTQLKSRYPVLKAISPSASQASTFSSVYAFSTLNLHKHCVEGKWSVQEHVHHIYTLYLHKHYVNVNIQESYSATSWMSVSVSSSR